MGVGATDQLSGPEMTGRTARNFETQAFPEGKRTSIWLKPLTSRGDAFLRPSRILLWMVLTILLVIGTTECLDVYLDLDSEVLEGGIHVLFLSLTLAPVLYFFWYRPLTQQMMERQRSEEEVRTLSHRLLAAGEDERRKLARDLHDEFGQRLTSLQLQMEALQQALARGERPVPETCAPMTALIRDIGTDLRGTIANLRPGVLEELGLIAALEGLCAQTMNGQNGQNGQNGLRVNFSSHGYHEGIVPEVETVLYRACQEALTNVVRHAGAGRVEVQLTCSYPKVILTVQDDGAGFPDFPPTDKKPRVTGHFGLIGLRERVASVGGSVRLSSDPGKGTRIRVTVPVTSRED